MDPDVKWLVVSGNLTDETLKRYLYGNAVLVSSTRVLEDDRYVNLHLVVVASTSQNVDLLAQNQSDRLRSGLYGAKAFDAYAPAFESIKDRIERSYA